MRYAELFETTLPPDVLDSAAKLLRQRAMATGLPDDSPEFKAKFIQWSKDQIAAKFEQISQLFNGNSLPVWREIIAPVDWQPDDDGWHPGIYWSWDRHGAYSHWGKSKGNEGVPWLLSAEVAFDQIDWVETLAQNATPSYADEKEIRLKPDADVTLLRYERAMH